MILTNRNGLPQPIVDAVTFDTYSRGHSHISCTELIGPPRIRELKRKHQDVLTEDVSDRLWALLGQIGHGILQRHAESQNGSSAYVEKRFFIDRLRWRISGQVDYLPDSKEINDYKFCSYHVAKKGAKPEWIEQQNVYRLMAMTNGVPVEALKVVAIYRDWSKMMATRQANYPQEQVHVFNLPIWSEEETEDFIENRLRLHQAAEKELPECTADERWEAPPEFALMKKGRKRAIKLYETEEEASTALKESEEAKDLFVEPRPSEWKRCEYFCIVAPYCTQAREYLASKAK
jgi:Ni/Co efflux regulator RcnB